MMAFRGIARAECYAIAKDRNQANVLFADAVAMANAPIVGYDDGTSLVSCGTLIARGTGEMTWMLEHPASGSKFRALAGDEKVSGPRPSLVAADEIHEWRNDGPLRMWRSSGAKMPGDFLLLMTTNTPAADQLVGTEYSARYQRILRGEIDDDAAFAYIARVDEQDDPINDEACWVKAMPCLDLTFPRDNVRIEVNSSKHSMGTLLNTQRLYFGIPVGASEYWIDLDAWEAVQGRVDEEEMIDYPCWLGMDLALKNDLTALGATWRDEGGMFHATVRYWKPAEGLALKAIEDNAPYVEWASATPPLLLLTPGKSIEYDFVAAEVERFCSQAQSRGNGIRPGAHRPVPTGVRSDRVQDLDLAS
jgi:phage terminase large subunit-like protein